MFNIAALVSVMLTLLFAGLGRWVGAGDPLRDLYAFPILIGCFALPLTLFTFASLSRRLGFSWARIDWGHGAVCLFAVALLIYNLRELLSLRALSPACWQDVLWYQRTVPPALACGADSAGGETTMPIVLGAVLAAYLGLGAGLWRQRRWPWLAWTMGAGVAGMLLPAAWGPLPWFLGQALCFCAIAWVAVRYVSPPGGEPAATG
jgi:hypothetical protein